MGKKTTKEEIVERDNSIIHTTYFGPVSWYRALYHGAKVDDGECYVKQTVRNHCRIATANGVQKLTVPVALPTKMNCPVRDVRISDHGNWRHQHWEALKSAYGMSPFFEYYADDILPFFTRRWDFLFDYNMEITQKMKELIGPLPVDKIPSIDNRTYYQTFHLRHGFIPDLSVLDLLFNMGPESILYIPL